MIDKLLVGCVVILFYMANQPRILHLLVINDKKAQRYLASPWVIKHGINLDPARRNSVKPALRIVGFQRDVHAKPNFTTTADRKPRNAKNEIVSKNITMILEDLLKNYESSQLPSHGKDKPTIVRTNILIRSMGPVSELDMEYSMDCYFRQYWRDQRLSFVGPIKSLSLSIKMLERIWRPDTYFYNGRSSYVHTITVPNKLLRISRDGDILYSMRLTIKAKCPMELQSFPMDRQSCPLILGSYAYTSKDLTYQWQNDDSVNFVAGMTLSQFDLISYPSRNFTLKRREGEFSVLEVSFNLQRHTGYFLINVYVPCILIVVLSWVSFWIHREATSDRVGLGITTVLTMSTISLDSRTDLPKVRYATALDWFLLMSFFYCIAALLEFAGVHYFTKIGSGEIPVDEDEWENCSDIQQELIGVSTADILENTELGTDMNSRRGSIVDGCRGSTVSARRRSSLVVPIYNTAHLYQSSRKASLVSASQTSTSMRQTMEKTTQTETKLPRWKQFLYCLMGDDNFRRQRQRAAAVGALESNKNGGHHSNRHVNSVSLIDRTARIMFPSSFGMFNLFYWLVYIMTQENFKWGDNKLNPQSH